MIMLLVCDFLLVLVALLLAIWNVANAVRQTRASRERTRR